MPSNAEQCRAMPINADQCWAMPSNAEQRRAMPSNAKQFWAIPSTAKQSSNILLLQIDTYEWVGFFRVQKDFSKMPNLTKIVKIDRKIMGKQFDMILKKSSWRQSGLLFESW